MEDPLPLLGLGCAALGGVYDEADVKSAVDVVAAAYNAGIRYFDTAPYYGTSETMLGRGLAALGKPRSTYFVATKCGRAGATEAAVKASVATSLERLQTDYLGERPHTLTAAA
jgi:L-galactose dehydrogenase